MPITPQRSTHEWSRAQKVAALVVLLILLVIVGAFSSNNPLVNLFAAIWNFLTAVWELMVAVFGPRAN